MKKRVLITGSSKGIGKSIAQTLCQNGYEVCLCGRDENALKYLAEKINAKGYCISDLTQQNSAKILYENATKILGNIDILVNNAGEYFYGAIENTDETNIDKLLTLNTKVPYQLISFCAKEMKKNNFGRIVNIGSISGTIGEANASLYSMTKSALQGMTKALALEFAQNNITINTINPGFVQTNLLENTFDKDFTKDELLDMIPQGRFIEPVEIANLVNYLISPEAKGLTGQSISLCAGMSIGC